MDCASLPTTPLAMCQKDKSAGYPLKAGQLDVGHVR
jgi:hypothetical protein